MSPRYRVEIAKSARKAVEKIDEPHRGRVKKAIVALADDPRPSGCKKLRGGGGYRIRVGDYRVIYDVDDGVVTVTVTDAGARGGIYG
ncbi:type II toxin-antitoxin system RelE/ParE family toxin [Nocardiopsis sp. NPDC050513]|uniref:type II toxin-antitoxin system RelE/ParE family toxin n=1 Tax=Nocardiopsis sp. NPDC050513 TaxID=3364338 RepID=UPI0037A85DD0